MKPTPLLLTTDVVLFGEDGMGIQQVLLIQRKNPPFKDYWALPGGFVDPGEDLLPAAKRELFEETSVLCEEMHQFRAYGNPDRDERGRVVTIAYWGIVNMDKVEPKAQDDAKALNWFPLNNLPDLAFDHALIIKDALQFKK